MNRPKMYPLLFDPIYEYRIWGGRRLAEILNEPLPANEPIGEAWILSDRSDRPSKISNGDLKGRTLSEVLSEYPEEILGKSASKFSKFPLLLKFLDAREMLSVQVHPSDNNKDLLPEGERGKTEAWVVLKADESSRIYAGLNPGTDAETIRSALVNGTVSDQLNSFTPKPGDGVFIPAGTVHTLGNNVVVFEVQQNSDVTFRLYDWDHIDAKTGKPRPLQIENAIASIDFSQGAISPVLPLIEETHPVLTERMFECDFFTLWRHSGNLRFSVGKENTARIIVCIEGNGNITNNNLEYPLTKGNVMLIPAISGVCDLNPDGPVTILEIALPK